MLKALIIDDEKIICEGIKTHLLSGNYGFTEILTAGSAEEALSLMSPAPHIIITDICMPQMSGLEFVKIIRSQNVTSKVIVLSGYNDFEYVRSMAVLGIENYLLKPINDLELHQTLVATITKLKKETELQIRNQLNENLIRENIINRWIYGSISETELTDRAEFLSLDLESSYFQPCILRILGTSESKNPALKQQCYDICCQIFSSISNCYYSRNYNGDLIAIFCLEEEDLETSKTAAILNSCMKAIRNSLSIQPYVLLGDVVEGYWNVASSFQAALGNGVHLNEIAGYSEITDSSEEQSSASSPFSYHLANYVLEHYQENLTLKTLAAHFKGNAAYIGQIFKRDIHKSFTEYLKYVRIEKSKELLLKSNDNVRNISQKVGFQNDTYFNTVFKNQVGLSPAEYRKKIHSNID